MKKLRGDARFKAGSKGCLVCGHARRHHIDYLGFPRLRCLGMLRFQGMKHPKACPCTVYEAPEEGLEELL